jgi:hypothetical protein
MVNDIMVNGHVGPKGNRLKVWESPSGHHLPENRPHGLEETDWSQVVYRLAGMKVETRA